MRKNGFFVALEGLDGSGKSSISKLIAAHFAATLGEDNVLHTFEPHNPSAAGDFVRAVLGKQIRVSGRTLALGFALNRADHNERVIDPFLETGERRIVLCDRYIMSSLVYQSSATLSLDDVATLNASARTPDLTLFLDVSPETGYSRIRSRGGERELFEERLAETRAKYLSVIDWLRQKDQQIAIIDANGDVDTVFANAVAAIRQYGPEWLTQP